MKAFLPFLLLLISLRSSAFILRSQAPTERGSLALHNPAPKTVQRSKIKKMVQKKEEQQDKPPAGIWETIQEKPATLVALPFVFLLGVDLILNIGVLTKRTIEYFLLGQAPNSDPWW